MSSRNLSSGNGTSIGTVTDQVYRLLVPVAEEERDKVINAVMALLGCDARGRNGPTEQRLEQRAGVDNVGMNGSRLTTSAQEYFDAKLPTTKGETLAVAARFVEESEHIEAATKDHLKRIIKAARRNFDDAKFTFDIANARNSGLFNKGSADDGYTLSYYGQRYVDALPDRERVRKLSRPRTRSRGNSRKATAGKASK